MADVNPEVMAMVRAELEKNPGTSSPELFERAKSIDPEIGNLSARQFNASYPLQVKRQAGGAKRDGKQQPAASGGAKRGAKRGAKGEAKAGAGGARRGRKPKQASIAAAAGAAANGGAGANGGGAAGEAAASEPAAAGRRGRKAGTATGAARSGGRGRSGGGAAKAAGKRGGRPTARRSAAGAGAASAGAGRGAQRQGAPAADAGDSGERRSQVKGVLVQFATDIANADDMAGLVRVMAGLDRYVEKVIKAAGR
jgi:hypothetical protein